MENEGLSTPSPLPPKKTVIFFKTLEASSENTKRCLIADANLVGEMKRRSKLLVRESFKVHWPFLGK